ncbi:MAG: hypothetical protein L6R39_005831 [Caloplaca ligustica]|nr:MAG: hypothetical protein L6R39_005831 [Caloplaca ligustica]
MGEPSSPPKAQRQGSQFTILPARSARDIEAIVSLFEAYADSLDIDLSFQSFQTELASLPGKYAPEHGGEILLARDFGGTPVGCVALRSLDGAGPACCEMKRLYVAPTGRGLGLGSHLAAAIVIEARALEYRTMKLDTLPTMTAALAVYGKLGFVETDAYYDNPITGARFLTKDLRTDVRPHSDLPSVSTSSG